MEQRYGKIVNVGGTFGMRGRAGRLAYSRRNGSARHHQELRRSKPARTTSTSIALRPGMVDGPRFRDKVCADMAKKLNITLEQAMERHAADYALSA